MAANSVPEVGPLYSRCPHVTRINLVRAASYAKLDRAGAWRVCLSGYSTFDGSLGILHYEYPKDPLPTPSLRKKTENVEYRGRHIVSSLVPQNVILCSYGTPTTSLFMPVANVIDFNEPYSKQLDIILCFAVLSFSLENIFFSPFH